MINSSGGAGIYGSEIITSPEIQVTTSIKNEVTGKEVTEKRNVNSFMNIQYKLRHRNTIYRDRYDSAADRGILKTEKQISTRLGEIVQ